MILRNKKKGFTLVELLVVVSIIGTLSTTVVGSLNDARQQARVAFVKAELKSLETAIELETQGDYTELCGTDTGFGRPTGEGINPVYTESSQIAQSIEDAGYVFSYCLGQVPWSQDDYSLNFVRLNSDDNYCMRARGGLFEIGNNVDREVVRGSRGEILYYELTGNPFCRGSYCDEYGCGN